MKNGADTVYQKILGDTIILEDSALIIERFGEVEYFVQEAEFFKKLRKTIVYREGDEIVLEERFSTYFKIPFVKGNVWTDVFNNTVVFYEDTFSLDYSLNGTVLNVLDLTVPAGTYSNVYKVLIKEREEIRRIDEVTLKEREEVYFFAPDVGPIKIEMLTYTENDTVFDVLELLDFR